MYQRVDTYKKYSKSDKGVFIIPNTNIYWQTHQTYKCSIFFT